MELLKYTSIGCPGYTRNPDPQKKKKMLANGFPDQSHFSVDSARYSHPIWWPFQVYAIPL